jgi:hypothetical protein
MRILISSFSDHFHAKKPFMSNNMYKLLFYFIIILSSNIFGSNHAGRKTTAPSILPSPSPSRYPSIPPTPRPVINLNDPIIGTFQPTDVPMYHKHGQDKFLSSDIKPLYIGLGLGAGVGATFSLCCCIRRFFISRRRPQPIYANLDAEAPTRDNTIN